MKNLLAQLTTTGMLLLLAGTAQATMLVSYSPSTDPSSDPTGDASGPLANLVSVADTTDSLLTFNGLGDYNNSATGWGITGSSPDFYYFARSNGIAAKDISEAVTNGEYLEFSLGATSGNQIDYNEFTVDWWWDAAPSNDAYISLYSDATGSFAAVDGFKTIAGSSSENFQTQTFDLSGLATSGDTYTFRLYIAQVDQSSSNIQRFDNLSLDGDVSVIPEPSTAALLLGGFGLAMLYRRRRS